MKHLPALQNFYNYISEYNTDCISEIDSQLETIKKEYGILADFFNKDENPYSIQVNVFLDADIISDKIDLSVYYTETDISLIHKEAEKLIQEGMSEKEAWSCCFSFYELFSLGYKRLDETIVFYNEICKLLRLKFICNIIM